jgi:hypothetical protein
MRHRLILHLGFVVLIACCAGCSDGLASLEGVVTIDGEPAPAGVAIEFCPTGEGSPSYGTTDGQGRYEAAFTFQKMGIEPGEHRLKLMPSDVEMPMPEIGPDGRPVGPPPENPLKGIPRAYYEEIELITVEPGSNTHDISLTTGDSGTSD